MHKAEIRLLVWYASHVYPPALTIEGLAIGFHHVNIHDGAGLEPAGHTHIAAIGPVGGVRQAPA